MEAFLGLGLALGLHQRVCAVALIVFLIPATLIAHPFWMVPSQFHEIQVINFFKNLSMICGLLFISSVNSHTTSAERPPS